MRLTRIIPALLTILATASLSAQAAMVGLALHQETGRDIYLGALHLDRPENLDLAMAGRGEPRSMEYRVVARRTSTRSLLGNMLLQAQLATGHTPSAATEQFAGDIMSAVRGSLYAGDSLRISLGADGVTRASLNGFALARSDDARVADYLLQGWLAEGGASTAFRQRILSDRLDPDLLANYDNTRASADRLAVIESWYAPEAGPEPETAALVLANTAPVEEPGAEAVQASTTPKLASVAGTEVVVASLAEPVDTATEDLATSENPLQTAPEADLEAVPEIPDPAVEPVSQETDGELQLALATAAPVLEASAPTGIEALDVTEYSQRLGRFNTLVMSRVYSNIRYPRYAVRRGLEGELELDAVIDAGGELVDLRLVQSSGYDALDQSALKAARKALAEPLAEIDPVARAEYGNREQQLVVPIPVKFKLTE